MSTPRLRLVLDTNVLVAALLTPGRTPDRALSAIFARGDVVLYDARLEAEYRAVLARPKFRGIDPGRAEGLLAAVLSGAEDVGAVERWEGAMTDADDRAFVEVALGGRADAVVTGNARHYPTQLSFAVLSPAALLERLGGSLPLDDRSHEGVVGVLHGELVAHREAAADGDALGPGARVDGHLGEILPERADAALLPGGDVVEVDPVLEEQLVSVGDGDPAEPLRGGVLV